MNERARPGRCARSTEARSDRDGSRRRPTSSSSAPRCSWRDGRDCSTSWPGWGAAGPLRRRTAGSVRRASLPARRRGGRARPARRRGRSGRLHRRAARRELAGLLLTTVRGVAPRPGPVAVLRDDDDATVLDCGDRGDLLVFPWLDGTPRPDVDLMVALEDPGSTTSPPRWCAGSGAARPRSGAGAAGRPIRGLGARPDLTPRLLRSGGSPEVAGADFGAEARALAP